MALQSGSDDRCRALIDAGVDATALLAEDGRLLFVSQAIEGMTGYTPAELTGTSAFELVHPNDVASVRAAFRRVLSTHEAVRIEYRARHKDGSWRRHDVVGINRLDDPAIGGVIVTYRDTAIHSVVEAALVERERRAAERLRAVISSVPIVLWAIDRDGRITLSEGSLLYEIGLEPGQVVGKSIFELYEDAPAVLDFTRAALRGESPTWILDVHGKTFSGSYTPLRDADGVVTGAIGVAIDVSERTHLEQKLGQTQKMEAIGRLAGGIAHDFNNLLVVIVGYAELALRQVKAGDPLRADIDEIRKAGQSAASLTRQLLAFSRQQLLQPQIVDLNTIVVRMTGLLRRLIGEHIDLRSQPADALDRVSADPGQIEQVILNLALNARDAMPRGGVLSVETANVELDEAHAADHPGSSAGPHVMLAISDTGMGMDRAVLSHLFEPFYTTKELGQGTGLGLATVYGIVNQSGGSILVHSEVDRGTSIKVFLPRVEHVIDLTGDVVEPPTGPDGVGTVLVVEDQAEVRSVVQEMLTRRGYVVLTAGHGDDALEVARRRGGGIDLLITDVVMPGMSGRDLAEQFLREYPGARVLYMSGYTDDGVVQQRILEHSVAFIQKPFTPALLLERVQEVLGAR